MVQKLGCQALFWGGEEGSYVTPPAVKGSIQVDHETIVDMFDMFDD